jgi:superfamily I DNA/RNA helicase
MDERTAGKLDGIGQQDHSLTREYRIFGPPGTGKTTHVANHVRHAVEQFGPNSVLVTSFSRATAAELATRDVLLDHDRIGTLHSSIATTRWASQSLISCKMSLEREFVSHTR